MGHGVVHIDLPEAREPLPDLLVRQDADAERRLAIDTLVECDLGTRQQADRNVWLSDRRESASNRIVGRSVAARPFAHPSDEFAQLPFDFGPWVKIAEAKLQATGCAGGSSYCTCRSARIHLRDQIESENSRSCRSTTV